MDNVSESLLMLVGELLYKNQLLREAMASKDEALELIINHLTCANTAACSCGIADQLGVVRATVKDLDAELARRFNESCNNVKSPSGSATTSPWNEAIRATEK